MRDPNENAISIAFATERSSGMDRGDLANLSAFVAVADQRSFRAAAAQLGVTPSALSQGLIDSWCSTPSRQEVHSFDKSRESGTGGTQRRAEYGRVGPHGDFL